VPKRLRSKHVFINCPFDAAYQPLFQALVFAVQGLGFVPRCALEDDDGGEVRLTKIERIIEECALGIHDLSAVELDAETNLPRFNMPLELGLFLGCRRFGAANQRRKASLVLDREPYRYRAFISDISGQDIHAHHGDPGRALRAVRNWLATTHKVEELPSGAAVHERYRLFQADSSTFSGAPLDPGHSTFRDFSRFVTDWLAGSR
jgi:hypothetical protein